MRGGTAKAVRRKVRQEGNKIFADMGAKNTIQVINAIAALPFRQRLYYLRRIATGKGIK